MNPAQFDPLQLIETQLELFKDNSLFLLIRNNEIVEASNRLIKLLGYEHISEMPRMFPELLPKAKPREFLIYHKLFLNQSYRQNYDLRLVGRGGHECALRFVAKRLPSDETESLAMLVGEDVTYQRKRLDELTVSSGLFVYNPYSIVITDHRGLIEKVNPKFEKRTHFKGDDVIGNSIFEYKSIPQVPSKETFHSILLQKEFRGEFKSRRADGTEFDEDLYVIPLYDYGELQRILFIGDDVTNQKNRLLSLEQKANYDDLTGLLRRDIGTTLLYEILESDKAFGLFFMDYRSFKNLNDQYGHSFGDDVLRGGSQRLMDALRQNDVLIRWGGDEFIAVTSNLHSLNDMEAVARKITNAFVEVFGDKDHSVQVSLDIGGCFVPAETRHANVRDVIRIADKNMYQAKQSRTTYIISVLEDRANLYDVSSSPGNRIRP